MKMPVFISVLHEYLGKAELTTSARHIERFSKSRIPIYNSKVLDTASEKKTRSRKKRRRQAIAMRYAFYVIAKILQQPLGTLQIIAPGKTKNSLKNILENILGFH